jgi:hypothetical protein
MTKTTTEDLTLIAKLRERIQAHGATEERPEHGWTLTDSGTPQFIGRHNTAVLHVKNGRYDLHVLHKDREIVGGEYKTLKAALTNGRMFANSNYNRDEVKA